MSFVPDQWYVILSSQDLKQNKPLALRRLGVDLVLWRQGEQLICLEDRCPHLGAALSGGKICQGEIECPFHGFRFNAQGECTLIPANGPHERIPAGMSVQRYLIQEAHGLIWLWWGTISESLPPLPMFESLQSPEWVYGSYWTTWPVHYTRAIENQLDMAHLPFVHRTTIGAGRRTRVQGPWVEAEQGQIKVWVLNEKEEGQDRLSQSEVKAKAMSAPPSLQFRFGNIWLLTISASVLNFIAFVPIDENETGYILRFYKRVQGPRWLNQLLAHAAGVSNAYILNQDRRVVITQRPFKTNLPSPTEHFIGADRAILQFRKMYGALYRST